MLREEKGTHRPGMSVLRRSVPGSGFSLRQKLSHLGLSYPVTDRSHWT